MQSGYQTVGKDLGGQMGYLTPLFYRLLVRNGTGGTFPGLVVAGRDA